MDKGLVSVILLNWNGGELVERCATSVLEQTHHPVELIVVDNASADGSVGRLQQAAESAEFILNSDNEGYSKAVNKGIRASKGEFVLTLNQDVLLDKEFVSRCVGTIRENPATGWVSGKLLRMIDNDAEPVLDSAGHVMYTNRYAENRGEEEPDKGQYDRKESVFGASGAAALYKREMLEDVKLGDEYLDESFVIMLEDVDLDWRARWRGWDCVYEPQALAYHVRSGSGAGYSRKVQRHYYKNRYLLLLKNDTAAGYLKKLPTISAIDALLVLDILFTAPVGMLQGMYDLARLFPATVGKRRAIRKGRKAEPAAIEAWFQRFGYRKLFERKVRGD